MADKNKPQFPAGWQEFVGQWERQVNELSAAVSGSDTFAGPMNQAARLNYAFRAYVDGALDKTIETMRLASHAQSVEIIERLDRIEERIDQLVAQTAPPSTPQSAPPAFEPRRTRRPSTS